MHHFRLLGMQDERILATVAGLTEPRRAIQIRTRIRRVAIFHLTNNFTDFICEFKSFWFNLNFPIH